MWDVREMDDRRQFNHFSSRSGLKDGKEYLVKGKYLYYHYLQDRFDTEKLDTQMILLVKPHGLLLARFYMNLNWTKYKLITTINNVVDYRMDDQGWGCAYRSMQTICSWIQLQYLALKDPSSKLTGAGKLKSVPNHEDIQKTLVNLGDKVR